MAIINTKRVAEIMGFSGPGTVYVICKRDENFPKPKDSYKARNGETAFLYDEAEIIEYKEKRVLKRKKRTESKPKKLEKGEIDSNLAISFLKRAQTWQ
jgi:predicted DNA-binding transcriptional regulator AlpA